MGDDGHLIGLLTYIVEADRCEILTLHEAERWRGVRTALIEEVERVAAASGRRRLWLLELHKEL